MSKRNGDRARFDRETKKKNLMREQSRKLRTATDTPSQGQGSNLDEDKTSLPQAVEKEVI